MTSGPFYLVLALSLSCSHCLVHWKIEELKNYHEFFPLRALEEEVQTVRAAESAVDSLVYGLNGSLSKVVDYQNRELRAALRQTAGTYNEDCVRGLSSYMTKVFHEVMATYNECTEEVTGSLKRVNNHLTSHWSKYNESYDRTIDDVNYCVNIYPNNLESRGLIEQCIKYHEERYFRHANDVQKMYNIDSSPAMSVFRGTVLKCVGDAFDTAVRKGTEFLGKMKCCIDSNAYLHWKPVKNTLEEQYNRANYWTELQIRNMENETKVLYSSHILSAEKYLYFTERKGFHQDLLYSLISPYFHTVNLTALHNIGDFQCVNEAKAALDNITTTGGLQLLELDKNIREKTTQLLKEMSQRIKMLNHLMPSIGNVAVLNCFSRGYIFAPDTILDCFKLFHLEFNISHRIILQDTHNDLVKLDDYLSYFKDSLNYPSVEFVVERSLLEAEKVLYELQRCLYKSSATIYPVTTPGVTSYPQTTTTSSYFIDEDITDGIYDFNSIYEY